MNKETFVWILQCSLLCWEGVSEEEMIGKYGADVKEARTGIKLCNHLKSITIPNEPYKKD